MLVIPGGDLEDQDPRPCYLKNNLSEKWAGGMAQVVEYLPTKFKALSSNPNTGSPQETKN
jgi:hypothetical protein